MREKGRKKRCEEKGGEERKSEGERKSRRGKKKGRKWRRGDNLSISVLLLCVFTGMTAAN